MSVLGEAINDVLRPALRKAIRDYVSDFGLLDNTAVTLGLDFTSGKFYLNGVGYVFDPLDFVTFARNSDAWYIAADGSLVKAVAGEMRKDDYSTGVKGLLKEPASSITMNNMMAGGGAGMVPTGHAYTSTVAGITRTVEGVGIEKGWPYVDVRLLGESTGANGIALRFAPYTSNPAVNGETWTGSVGLKILGGSSTGFSFFRHVISLRDAATNGLSVSYGENLGSVVTSGARTRISQTVTLNNASVAFVGSAIELAWGATPVALDITIRIYAPQLEKGAVATSPILSDSSTVTKGRVADSLSIVGANFASFYNQTEGTFVMDVTRLDVADAKSAGFFSASDGTSANVISVLDSSSNDAITGYMLRGGSPQAVFNSGITRFGGRSKFALAYKENATRLVVNAVAYNTADTSCLIPTVNRLLFGVSTSAVASPACVLHSLKYYPKAGASASLVGATPL